jgi:hypothetical protein
MKSSSITWTCGALALLSLSAPVARAQTVSSPIIVRTANPTGQKSGANAKGEWLKGEVIHADAQSIVVAEQGNERMIHTFTVSPALKNKMQAIVDRGGYQYGDKVKILHAHGQTEAIKISGKPSKPS